MVTISIYDSSNSRTSLQTTNSPNVKKNLSNVLFLVPGKVIFNDKLASVTGKNENCCREISLERNTCRLENRLSKHKVT